MMKQKLMDDFILYAKKMGYDITAEPSQSPDTFEKVFGINFINNYQSIAEYEAWDIVQSSAKIVTIPNVPNEFQCIPSDEMRIAA